MMGRRADHGQIPGLDWGIGEDIEGLEVEVDMGDGDASCLAAERRDAAAHQLQRYALAVICQPAHIEALVLLMHLQQHEVWKYYQSTSQVHSRLIDNQMVSRVCSKLCNAIAIQERLSSTDERQRGIEGKKRALGERTGGGGAKSETAFAMSVTAVHRRPGTQAWLMHASHARAGPRWVRRLT